MASLLDGIRRSVVKVFTQSDAPEYDQPWQTQGVVSSVGSGFVVATGSGPRIVTNAHVVENQVFVEIRRFGRPAKYVTEVEGVGHECDLALLAVSDRSFLDHAVPLRIGALPPLGETVTVLGYPIGGERLSLTRGIVSRIEMAPYAQSQRRLLCVQIDAAVNPGNSGGPVVDEAGKLVGVAFQALDEGENISYMIGAPVVRHFLQDMQSGTFDGFPHLGVQTQSLSSAAHRRWLGLPARYRGGVLITGVVYQGSAWRQLRRGDVLLKLGSEPVAADGSVKFRTGERIRFSYLVAQHHVGDTLPVTFWRDGRTRTAQIRLAAPRYLVPEDRYDVKPTYFVYGGLLFAPLSRDYLKTWDPEWWTEAPSHLVAIYENAIRTAARQEVVILQRVMADRVNQGYHDLESRVVVRVQGKKIRHLSDLVHTVERARGKFVRFDLEDGDAVVLERSEVRARHGEILRKFGVPRDRSADLCDELDQL